LSYRVSRALDAECARGRIHRIERTDGRSSRVSYRPPPERQRLSIERQPLPTERQSAETERQSFPTERQGLWTERRSAADPRQSLATDRGALATERDPCALIQRKVGGGSPSSAPPTPAHIMRPNRWDSHPEGEHNTTWNGTGCGATRYSTPSKEPCSPAIGTPVSRFRLGGADRACRLFP